MIHEAIATGATVDEARANAIAELKAPKDADVHNDGKDEVEKNSSSHDKESLPCRF